MTAKIENIKILRNTTKPKFIYKPVKRQLLVYVGKSAGVPIEVAIVSFSLEAIYSLSLSKGWKGDILGELKYSRSFHGYKAKIYEMFHNIHKMLVKGTPEFIQVGN